MLEINKDTGDLEYQDVTDAYKELGNKYYRGEQIDILGKKYLILKNEELPEDVDGVCDKYGRIIKIAPPEKMKNPLAPGQEHKRKKAVLRHEIIHAFLFESGLESYCDDELLVDWLALRLPEIVEACAKSDCLQLYIENSRDVWGSGAYNTWRD